MYYLNSRYYNPEIGRFLNADDINYLGADGSLLSYNLFAYCGNNPVMGYDPLGHFNFSLKIVATGAIVGALMGAFTAACTGGDVGEGAIEGLLTGAISATCGVVSWGVKKQILQTLSSAGVGVLGGVFVDFTTQAVNQYIENKHFELSDIDFGRMFKVGLQTGIGAAVPSFKNAKSNVVDAVGTVTAWIITSVWIAVADVISTHILNQGKAPSAEVPQGQQRVAIYE